jgi:hypothetical protein
VNGTPKPANLRQAMGINPPTKKTAVSPRTTIVPPVDLRVLNVGRRYHRLRRDANHLAYGSVNVIDKFSYTMQAPRHSGS